MLRRNIKPKGYPMNNKKEGKTVTFVDTEDVVDTSDNPGQSFMTITLIYLYAMERN